MIDPGKIEEWLREVEERPSSASTIIRYIANRLSELASRNEELRAENIELRSGQKVEDYESRISNLEYQVELLKRQFGGDAPILAEIQDIPMAAETASLMLYTAQGRVLRTEIIPSELVSGGTLASLLEEIHPGEIPPDLLVTSSHEELLNVFDSGRTTALPVAGIPVATSQLLDWGESTLQEPRGVEELVTILPIARMSLYDFCIQASRKGFVKKIKEASLETYVANSFIGAGVRLPPDKTCNLTLCRDGDLFVMVSREGALFSMEVSRLPLTIEEALRLGTTDHIVASFVTGQKPSIVVVTQNGKVIHRQASWLEPASSFKTRGQPLFSKERREAGVRVVGAAAVDEDDWAVALSSDGKLAVHQMGDLFSAGSLLVPGAVTTGQARVEILGFTTFRMPPARLAVNQKV